MFTFGQVSTGVPLIQKLKCFDDYDALADISQLHLVENRVKTVLANDASAPMGGPGSGV